ncbi:hypothetical protein Y032_0480g2237 [Ancylostoma ceylanicum]|uniref:SAC3/GANP/THP3 conserved domain-containing protein n=1 Tax=Ancylostoma ceylanicum TaxID=53326 RepID=A0A016WXP3_9BILA|nr:hypothetical protein Y032_0480g2237 [Ancylostoma ceylanicum]
MKQYQRRTNGGGKALAVQALRWFSNMPLEGFKIPGSFLKRKNDDEHPDSADEGSSEIFQYSLPSPRLILFWPMKKCTSETPIPITKRAEFPSSRLFGNLTRGGPTSVQNPARGEGVRFAFNKGKDRRFADLIQESSRESISKNHSSAEKDSVSRFKLIRNVDKNSKPPAADQFPALSSGFREERLRPASIFRKRSSSSLAASAAAVKRATKLVRAKRSNSREESDDTRKYTGFAKSPSSAGGSPHRDAQMTSPSKFRAVSYAAESLTANREQAVILRSLLALVGRHCPTEYDKYVLLEERDKLLSKLRDEENRKIGVERQTVKGTCPGMCTEKERYVRVVQKRISQYECDPDGSLNPNRMVKEYARSAADQDNPLPHELRSKELLENSMGYLLKHVLDSVPESEDDLVSWYDFLWSRTRAIRKEITQLMLSDGTAVALIERSARLHILCAYKLCHLGVEKFDQNMNTENLAKCLQSLRHLYEDLAAQGIVLETEAEFRGYDVMLHLYDSNILRQVLSYRKEVRDSRPVRLALQLSSALQNKNYVRFFRLLKTEATFLQCCICHRYFNTVQSKALLTMMTAYGRNSVFPLDTMWRVLAWDEREDALKSLALYGVHQNDMDCDQVVLNRDHFSQDMDPDLRPYRWIDAKNTASWSQVAHGPTPFSFSPASVLPNSFDDADVYNNDDVLSAILEMYSLQAEAQQRMLVQQHPLSVPASDSRARSSGETLHWVTSKVENVVNEVVDEQSLSICRSVEVEEVSTLISNDIIDEAARKFIMEVMLEEREAREREQAYLESERVKEEKGKLVRTLVERVVGDICSSMLKKVLREELHGAILTHIDSAAHFIVDELWRSKLVHIIDRETKAVLKNTLKSDLEEVQAGLQRFRDRMELLWLRQFWDVWRSRVLESRRKRLQRLQDWEHFQGVWNCKMFVPSNYVTCDGSEKKRTPETSPSHSLVSSRDTRIALRVIQLKKKRSNRIVRVAFDRWRDYVQRRRLAQSIAKACFITYFNKTQFRGGCQWQVKRNTFPCRQLKEQVPVDVECLQERAAGIQKREEYTKCSEDSWIRQYVILHRGRPLDPKVYIDCPLPYGEKAKRRRIESPLDSSLGSLHCTSDPLQDSSNFALDGIEDSPVSGNSWCFEPSAECCSMLSLSTTAPFRPPSPCVHVHCDTLEETTCTLGRVTVPGSQNPWFFCRLHHRVWEGSGRLRKNLVALWHATSGMELLLLPVRRISDLPSK